MAAIVLAGAVVAGCSSGGAHTSPPRTASSVDATRCAAIGTALSKELSLPNASNDDPSFANDDAPLSQVLPGSGHAAHDPVLQQTGCQLDFANGGTTNVQVLFLRARDNASDFDTLLIGGLKSDGMSEIGGVGQRASYLGSDEGDQPFGELHVLVSDGYGFSVQVHAVRATSTLAGPDGIRRIARVVLAAS